MKHQDDPISTPPIMSGIGGRAWTVDITEARVRAKVQSDSDSTVAIWLIEAPWAHPVWHSYRVVLIHLRPLNPPKDTMFYLPDATHEVWVHALDPDRPRAPGLSTAQFSHLMPINFGAQIVADNDATAMARVESAVSEIVCGRLSPDTDHTSAWVQRFGDNMLRGKKKCITRKA